MEGNGAGQHCLLGFRGGSASSTVSLVPVKTAPAVVLYIANVLQALVNSLSEAAPRASATRGKIFSSSSFSHAKPTHPFLAVGGWLTTAGGGCLTAGCSVAVEVASQPLLHRTVAWACASPCRKGRCPPWTSFLWLPERPRQRGTVTDEVEARLRQGFCLHPAASGRDLGRIRQPPAG